MSTEQIPIINHPTFTRNSVAYLSDGTQVVANMPRFEPGKFGKAIMVEEGTTNLAPQDMTASDWIKETSCTVEATGETFNGMPVYRVTFPAGTIPRTFFKFNYSDGQYFTGSIWYRFVSGYDSGEALPVFYFRESGFGTIYSAKSFSVTTEWSRLDRTHQFSGSGTCMFLLYRSSGNTTVDVVMEFALPQLEQKPYPTSFTDGTRSPESLTIHTAGVLNPQEGTIECWVYVDNNTQISGVFRYVFATGEATNRNCMYFRRGSGGDWNLDIYDANSSRTYLGSYLTFSIGWHYLAIRWQGSHAAVFVDGLLYQSTNSRVIPANFGSLLYIGSHLNGSYKYNSLIDDLRISNRARTDEEILAAYQNNAPLVVDKWTTYKLNFDNNLNFEQGAYTSSALENIYTEYDIINSTTKKYVYKIEWLNPQEEVIGDVIADVISGSANFDATSNNRRSVTITLRNHSKQYIPSPTSKMWINNKFRLLCGYQYGNKQLLYNQGVYVLGNPSLLSNSTQKEVTIQGLDKWVLLDGTIAGELKNKYIINVGTRIDVVIKSLITEIAGETKYIIDECSDVTPYTVEKPAGSTIAEILLELANIVSYDVYYNEEGYLCFKKPLRPEDYAITPPVWKYTTSHLYIESNRELDWNNIRNSIVVYGMTDEDKGIQYKGFAKDETGSELSIDKIGERVKVIEDDNIYSNDLCEQRARYELQQYIMAQETVNMTIVPNFKMKLDDVINIEDEGNGAIGNYAIRSISFNIGYDSTMNLGVWAIRKIA